MAGVVKVRLAAHLGERAAGVVRGSARAKAMRARDAMAGEVCDAEGMEGNGRRSLLNRAARGLQDCCERWLVERAVLRLIRREQGGPRLVQTAVARGLCVQTDLHLAGVCCCKQYFFLFF